MAGYTAEHIIPILEQYPFAILPYEVTQPNINFCLPNKFYQCVEAELPLITSNMNEMGDIITRYGLGYVFTSGDNVACANLIANCSVTGDDYVELVRNVSKYKASEVDYEQQKIQLLNSYSGTIERR
jgi:hypothetical protein